MTFDVATIGFTQTSAERFFDRLAAGGVRKLIDVRLHNTSQLSGFAKSDDLAFFLRSIGNISYQHMPLLAPDDRMLAEYKKVDKNWPKYETSFLNLMAERRVEDRLDPADLDGACLLCSEARPHHCHRRLVVDYLNSHWDNVLKVHHL